MLCASINKDSAPVEYFKTFFPEFGFQRIETAKTG